MDKRLSTYERTETEGKSQLDLILKVYDGALVSLREARQHYEADNNDSGYQQLERFKRFVTHLYTTLDMEQGGEVADNLARLYAYLINQANVAQATKDLAVIDDNMTIVSNIRDGWQGLKEQQAQSAPPMTPTPAAPNSTDFTTTA